MTGTLNIISTLVTSGASGLTKRINLLLSAVRLRNLSKADTAPVRHAVFLCLTLSAMLLHGRQFELGVPENILNIRGSSLGCFEAPSSPLRCQFEKTKGVSHD